MNTNSPCLGESYQPSRGRTVAPGPSAELLELAGVSPSVIALSATGLRRAQGSIGSDGTSPSPGSQEQPFGAFQEDKSSPQCFWLF